MQWGSELGWLAKRDLAYLRGQMSDISITVKELSAAWKKQYPRCAVCGYDAEWIVKLDKLERLFCERDLLNALFDALNFALPAEAA